MDCINPDKSKINAMLLNKKLFKSMTVTIFVNNMRHLYMKNHCAICVKAGYLNLSSLYCSKTNYQYIKILFWWHMMDVCKCAVNLHVSFRQLSVVDVINITVLLRCPDCCQYQYVLWVKANSP